LSQPDKGSESLGNQPQGTGPREYPTVWLKAFRQLRPGLLIAEVPALQPCATSYGWFASLSCPASAFSSTLRKEEASPTLGHLQCSHVHILKTQLIRPTGYGWLGSAPR
jgi:hypothetical protein